MKQHTQALRGQNAYGGLSCSVPDSCSALLECRALEGERHTAHGRTQPGPYPVLWHSFCQQGDSSFPSSSTYAHHGYPRTCILAPKAQVGPEMELKHGATATISTSSNSCQGNRQPTVTGYSWESWERQDWSWEQEEAALSQTQVEGLLSWREPPQPTLSQQSLHRGAIWLVWAPGA